MAPVGLGVAVLVLFAAGSAVRDELGFSFSLEGLNDVRSWVAGLGWKGPAVFVGLVTFRAFLLLPSYVVLILGGLVFGALVGTLWGAIGLGCSALMQFAAARLLGDDWVRPRLGARHSALEERIRQLGPVPVFAVTALPAGPLTPVNIAAGLVGLAFWQFVIAVGAGAPIRAGLYSMLGVGVLSWDPWVSVLLGVGFVALFVLPLAHPRIRSWVFATGASNPAPDEKA
jgi:uncharacterized membrane protein YdjX (TVP38/TMEM64 family)